MKPHRPRELREPVSLAPRLCLLKATTPASASYIDSVNPKFVRYAITDRTMIPDGLKLSTAEGGLDALSRQAARLAAEGVEFLQLREKDLPASELVAVARRLLRAVGDSETRLLINGRADVAIATAAHGVHLSSLPEELTPRQVHDLYARASLPAPVVTISCHTLADVIRHRLAPITAILFGPVFEKSVSGEHRAVGTGLALLRQACIAAAPVPILALGGITATDAAACLEAGASGVAGIRLFQRD
jgi:thiamine-phosphate pyrophosphorylase